VPTLFLYSFFVGFSLTLISALLGFMHMGGDMHGHAELGHGHVELGHGHGGVGHADTPGAHGQGHGSHADAGKGGGVSPLNFQTLMAFLMGFGGVGYLVTLLGPPGLLLVLPLAAGAGLGSAWLIFKWLSFLVRGESPLGPTSYEGLVGRLTASIREGGTGEIVYTHHGTRTALTARSESGAAIPRGEEVVVLRYAKGIAYVEPIRAHTQETIE
jgi:membrane protein implicated in regulation of membrane protease activity